jgi:hypothetical protein
MRSSRPDWVLFALVAGVSASVLVRGSEQKQGRGPMRLDDGIPIGTLGHRLGDYLTIEGVRENEMKVSDKTIWVDTVNGKKLRERVLIEVENVSFDATSRNVLKGYESFRMAGPPPAWIAFEKEQGRNPMLPPTVWRVNPFFVALDVVKPPALRQEFLKEKAEAEKRRRDGQ